MGNVRFFGGTNDCSRSLLFYLCQHCNTNHVFVVCYLIVLTHKFVAYVEYKWATCTVVAVGFSCAPGILYVYVEAADCSIRMDELGRLDMIL